MPVSLPYRSALPASITAAIIAAALGGGATHAAEGPACRREASEPDGSSFIQMPRGSSDGAPQRQGQGASPFNGAQLLAADAAELYWVNVTGDNFVFRSLLNNPTAGPANKPCPFKDCGGYVYATNGGPGKFQAALVGLDTNGGAYGSSPLSQWESGDDVSAVAQVQDGSAFTCVFFHILPNGTHPWHIHEHMNEFVTVVGGSGVLDIIDPETQKVYTFPAVVGRVLTLPHGFMHMFRASREGLNLLAFGDVEGATLALLPTFMAVLPEGLRSTILGRETAEAVQDGFEWLGQPNSGDAFVCEPNSDFVQEVLDSNSYLECEYGIADTPDSSTLPCTTKSLANMKATEAHSFVTFGSLSPSAGDAECLADGAWCSIQDLSFAYSYVQMVLRPRQLLAGLMPSGAMIGYVTKGSVWVAFYHPNSAYLLQFTANETDLIYIPGDVYFMFLSLEDDSDVQLNLGIQAFQKTRLRNGYRRARVMPLGAALAHMGPALSGAAFYPDLEKAAQDQATKESTVLNKPRKQASLVFELSEAIYNSMKSDIGTWSSTTILCLSANPFCYCKTKDCALAPGLPQCAGGSLPEGLLDVQGPGMAFPQAAAGKTGSEPHGKANLEPHGPPAADSLALMEQVKELRQQNIELMMRLERLEKLVK